MRTAHLSVVQTIGIAALLACQPLSSLQVKPAGTYSFTLCDGGGACADVATLQYLGVGGFVLRKGSDAIMMAPEFTHPSLLALPLERTSDASLVHRLFQRFDTTGIRTILVGHSHYDHLMDVPTILQYELPLARVVSTPTTRFTLMGDSSIDTARLVGIDTAGAGTRTRAGRWHYIRGADGTERFRVMALISTHAPNLGNYTIANDTLRYPLVSLPERPMWWPKGEVYSFIIDVIRPDRTPAFRVFYQDAASDPEHAGLPPFTGTDIRRPDVAVICAGNFSETDSYPTVLLREMNPRFALVGHWEDFFRSAEDSSLHLIPFLRGDELRDRVREQMDKRWATLRPFSTATFRYDASH